MTASPDARTILRARLAATLIRDQADFNRSWTDGRREPPRCGREDLYQRRRLAHAQELDRLADAVEVVADCAVKVLTDAASRDTIAATLAELVG